jgi:hypothetical protein
MAWEDGKTYSTSSIADAVFSRMGLDPSQALDQEKAAAVESINRALVAIWTHYPWFEVLEVVSTAVSADSDGDPYVGMVSDQLECEGIYAKNPDKNPTASSLSFRQVRNSVHILGTQPAIVYMRYWPVPPVITTGTLSTAVVPWAFHSYIISRGYSEMLIGDGQHEKSSLIAAEAEKNLYDLQHQSERRKQGINL